jgi:hypothetical protein
VNNKILPDSLLVGGRLLRLMCFPGSYSFRWLEQITEVYRNRATLAVARRLVAYMVAVDKSCSDFSIPGEQKAAKKKRRYSSDISNVF